MPRQPMNVVFITTDQMRGDSLACAGNPIVRTPNLDRLAAEGTLAERMYVAQPLCMPSRATIITGTTPRVHGVWTNGIPLSPEIPTFGEVLWGAGYHTALIGKAHFRPYGFDGGEASPAEVERGIGGNEEGLASTGDQHAGPLRKPYHSHIVLDISANQSKGHADVPNQGVRYVFRSDSAHRLLWF